MTDLHLQGLRIPSATLDQYLKARSRLPYRKALSQLPTPPTTVPSTTITGGGISLCQPTVSPALNSELSPPLPPPGMTRSQHFFTIATRIDARAMQISGDTEFHLFMDMRAEFGWISFKMTPKQWALATETYNTRLEEKDRANGRPETVKKHPQALLRKLGEIEVMVMNRMVKTDFKCES